MDPNRAALSKAELYLCLARAFAVPNQPGAWEALRDALPGDLAELAALSGYPIADAAAALREAMERIGDGGRLLLVYSRLFLVPGDAHPSLNAGAYLDGALGGGTVAALEACYQRCGLERDAGFRDLSDHVSVQLELLAWLFGAEAQAAADGTSPPPVSSAQLLRGFVARWVGAFRRDLEQASGRFGLPENPYLVLARVLERAVLHEARQLPAAAPDGRPSVDPEIARLREELAGRALTEEDMAIIRERLAAQGLPHGHVAIPVDMRDRTMGLAAMTPPAAPTHRRALER